MASNKTDHTNEQLICKNCGTEFIGNFCPQCGQSVKEFERPLSFLIVDLMGNVFAFDTRFWKTLVAVLFKPGTLALDYVKGHRVRYMPPFRFYVFVSFIFFFLMNIQTQRSVNNGDGIVSGVVAASYNEDQGHQDIEYVVEHDSVRVDSLRQQGENDVLEEDISDLVDDHPEILITKFLKYLSWSLFLLMPLHAFLLWLFFRNRQQYYITHLILSINQHAFTFVVFIVIVALDLLFVGNEWTDLLFLVVPVYFVIGQKRLFEQKVWKVALKTLATGILYFIVLIAVTVLLVIVAFEVKL